jgi:hypothetical protein
MLDWEKYIAVAERFQHKAKAQDREDLKHTIYIKDWRRSPVITDISHSPKLSCTG